tara:strand:- start:2322 stop:3713 length:1392 start_codon:yes stop_codon:yes gene_type:complete
MFWLDQNVSVPKIMDNRHRASQTMRKRINLYVGTPYCLPTEPDRCGFCLFPSEVYRDRQQLDTYLSYLRKEGEMFRPYLGGAELASVYFGGGTSNLYKADQYPQLMDMVRDMFDVPPQLEVTLEGIPQTFTHEKLAAMKACGINRISMGVQQLDDELIKASGRKQTSAQVFETITSCQRLELPISVDLIFGWPSQTVNQMLHDLRAIVDTGINHVTHYELNVAGRTDFSRNRRETLPSTEQNLEMYQVGKAFLESEGFRQVTPYDFERTGPLPSTYLYEQLFRQPFQDTDGEPVGYDAWGWGFAGISFFFGTPDSPGSAYMNHVHVDQYFREIDANHFPVLRGYQYSAADLRLHLLFQELQGLSVNRQRYTSLFGCDVVNDHTPIWMTLRELGWVSIDDEFVTIEENGAFYLPLIQNMLAHDRSEAMRKQRTISPQQSQPSTSVASPKLPEDIDRTVEAARAS